MKMNPKTLPIISQGFHNSGIPCEFPITEHVIRTLPYRPILYNQRMNDSWDYDEPRFFTLDFSLFTNWWFQWKFLSLTLASNFDKVEFDHLVSFEPTGRNQLVRLWWNSDHKQINNAKKFKMICITQIIKILRFSTSLTILSGKYCPTSIQKTFLVIILIRFWILYINLTCSISSFQGRFRINHFWPVKSS